ncbi:hypothetical protein ABK905_06585 [Acerihabitans sp. KWT182]|uniref:RHS repeat protein n=1 Tax=Acerihabitans sp. KWT182 TaxID=3157919 RepID=A0AAU7QCA0_9GAMM
MLTSAVAAESCADKHRRVNDNNNLIMLDGNARGNIKMMVSGMVGKDVDEQASGNIRFSRCGVLSDALFDYHKSEGHVILRMVNHTVKAQSGWESAYEIAVIIDKEGTQTLATHKQGKITFATDKSGLITSSTDSFTINDQKGFTTTVYSYDKQHRLVKSVARGSDALANDQYVYNYDKKGLLSTTASSKGSTTYHYDDKERELGSNEVSTTSISQISKIEDCQRFDTVGNCVLSYGRETEIFPLYVIKRHRSTAMQYQYW